MKPEQDLVDNLDRRILNILLNDANTPYVEIAKRLHTSPGTVHVRLKKLRQLGILRPAFLNVDRQKLGFDVSAFVGLHLDRSAYHERVVRDLSKIPEVVNIHYLTGPYNLLVRLVCRDMQHLHQVLSYNIQQINGVLRTETMLSLDEPLHRPLTLPEDWDLEDLERMKAEEDLD